MIISRSVNKRAWSVIMVVPKSIAPRIWLRDSAFQSVLCLGAILGSKTRPPSSHSKDLGKALEQAGVLHMFGVDGTVSFFCFF